MLPKCSVYKIGLKDYTSVWKYQKALFDHVLWSRKSISPANFEADALIVTEHPPVYTIGKGGGLDNIKFNFKDECMRHPEVYRVERGGEVTYHGPGMLMFYPILDLNRHQKSLRWYVNSIEDVIIRSLHKYGIHGQRLDINNGVWIGDNKVSAVGISVSHWITFHGFALNVNCDMRYFEDIVPCGITDSGKGVCSLSETNPLISKEAITNTVIKSFSEVFNVDVVHPHDPQGDLDKILLKFPPKDLEPLRKYDIKARC